jgi:hypothetical protein
MMMKVETHSKVIEEIWMKVIGRRTHYDIMFKIELEIHMIRKSFMI